MRTALRKVISLDFSATGEEQPLPDIDGFGDARQRIALLATSDKLSQQWAPRWLEHSGFDVRFAETPEEALGIASATRPNLMLVDAGLPGPEGSLLLNQLRKIHGEEVPMIALCGSAKDAALASQTDATDVMRRPLDWQIITQRAVRAVIAHETKRELQSAKEKLRNLRIETRTAARDRARTAGLDSLTGLPNGERFRSLSHKSITANGKSQTSIIAIGLNQFRLVNEAVGRDHANEVLQQFSKRLTNCISKRHIIGTAVDGTVTAIAARLGGARFAVQISNGNDEQVERFRDAVIEELKEPFQVKGQSIYLNASLGAATYPTHCNGADELLHCAESAMLEASNTGVDFGCYDPESGLRSTDVLRLDCMLRDALQRDQLALHYQPITDTTSGEVVAAEALLRWDHPVEGPISPAVFVPIAEKTGLMQEIGDFVIDSACAQLRDWIDSGMRPIRIAINVSLCQLTRGDVVETALEAIENYGIDPSLLEFELSERGVLNAHPAVINEVRRLKKTGARISVDDFGTGQSAIAYLKDLPIDVIKIDRSYISGAITNDRHRAIASGMVTLAQRLDATVVSEGVETTEQLEMLRQWGSQECQGFLFSPAVPGDEFRAKFGR